MDKDSKKDLIADAALACFLSTGYGGTSVDDIVKASGMSKGGIYWHFKSRVKKKYFCTFFKNGSMKPIRHSRLS